MKYEEHRIGILGGTFNPIHLGHLMIAEMALEAFQLDRIIFVPAQNPPHKQEDIISSDHRLAMVEIAILDNPKFVLSDVEMKRHGKSYTYDTISYFKELYGEKSQIFFIAGTDTIQDLPYWYNIDKLIDMCEFIGAIRPDGSKDIENIVNWFGPKGSRIHLLEVPEIKLSATDLRYRLRHGLSTRYMLPKSVYQYIKEHKIYEHNRV